MSQFEDFGSIFAVPNKTAVVTGGSRGLGLHAATGLLLAGASTVIITSRKADACDAAVKALKTVKPSATVVAIPADLSKPVRSLLTNLYSSASFLPPSPFPLSPFPPFPSNCNDDDVTN